MMELAPESFLRHIFMTSRSHPIVCVLSLCLITSFAFRTAGAQSSTFVTRSGNQLFVDGHPFYFLGTNAYYLLEEAARGDTTTVRSLFETARALGMTVVRTWGFHDSSDSLNQSVIQYRPGAYNEHALRGLDYVIEQARRSDVRLIITLVNNWDDYGGMNQYVRWRAGIQSMDAQSKKRYSADDQVRTVSGQMGRSYQLAISDQFGHDDFYADEIIKSWYKTYIETVLNRVNTLTGIAYKDEPAIFGWELANEPRSSDRSTTMITYWVREMAMFVKTISRNQLTGSGEEGFDQSASGYSISAYNNQQFLFDGTSGCSFTANTAIESIDFAGIHLYPESWSIPNNAGNAWIRDHLNIAGAYSKPLLIGEFGVLRQKPATYDSWLTTALLDEAAGALVWQILEGNRSDLEGFGFRCPEEEQLCAVLENDARQFQVKSITGFLPVPSHFSLLQNYPNPFNEQTTISYDLPFDAHAVLTVFSTTGQLVAMLVDGYQRRGIRKELFGGRGLASGVYVARLSVEVPVASAGREYAGVKKMVLVK